jgi:hypothetical protein
MTNNQIKSPAVSRGAFDLNIVMRMKRSVLGRPGSDLLFQALRLSTIGAEDFDGRVRDGIGYRLLAIATRPAKDGTEIVSRDSGVRKIPGCDFEAS